MEKVYVIVIRHEEGANYYAATSEASMFKQVADFCRSEWTEDCERDMGELPTDDRACVEYYFSEKVFGDEQSWAGELVDLVEPPERIYCGWTIEDAKTVCPSLTDDEAREVMEQTQHDFDAEAGMSWDNIRTAVAELFPTYETEN